MDRTRKSVQFARRKPEKLIGLTIQSRLAAGFVARRRQLRAEFERHIMKRFAALIATCLLAQAARAETTDCKTIPDPALRLTCYDKINPPVATYPIPLPKPSHFIPLTRPDGTPGYAGSAGDDEVAVNSKMNSICRGC
jgi:hypothetical protein